MVTRKKKQETGIEAAKAVIAEREGTGKIEREPQRNLGPTATPGPEQKYTIGVGGKQYSGLTRESYERIKSGMGFGGTLPTPDSTTQKEKDILKLAGQSSTERIKDKIATDPTQFGLEQPGTQGLLEQPPGFETITEDGNVGLGSQILDAAKSQIEGTQVFPQPIADLTGLPGNVDVPIGIKAVLAAGALGAVGWVVGGTTYVSATKAAQAGTAAKNSAVVKPLATKVRDWAIGGYAALKGTEGLVSYFVGRQLDEQQAAVNTLGQMATTIGGASTEATGDWRKGLAELKYIKNQVLFLESAIKAGSLEKASIKYNGKIYDINADMSDQLSTIDEQITIIESFVVSQSFPELSELEAQNIIRELESEGYVEPVDLTTSRRPTE